MFLSNRLILPMSLQFFAEADGGQAGGGAGEQQQQGQTQDPQGQGSDNAHEQGNDGSQQQNENMIPKSRFDEVNVKYKTLKDELDTIKNKQQQDELDEKKKQGEFEELYNTASQELETYKTSQSQASERVEQLEGIIQTLVDAELEGIPEDMRDLIPDNFTPEQKLSWIGSAKQKGLFGTVQNKEEQELGGSTNQQQQQKQDVSKMSVGELFRSAYGK